MRMLLNYIRKGLVYFFLFFIFASVSVTAQPNGEGLVLGKTYKVHSNVLNEDRLIYVYLPDGYFTSQAKYPVVYLLDGYEHFHYTSGMVKALASNNKIPQMIVIGILNVDRYRDFTPIEKDYFPNSGHADKFTRFLKEELFAFVEKYYRIQPHRVLVGHSLGGLFAINTFVNDPGIFNTYIASSPALLHIDSVIKNTYPGRIAMLPNSFRAIYFTIGGRESEEIIGTAKSFRDLLAANSPSSIKWNFDLMPEDDHSSLIFSSLYNGFLNNYSDWEIPISIADLGFESIQNYYKNLSENYGYEINLNANLINSIVKKQIALNHFEPAIAILVKATPLFSQSASLRNNLGVAYEKNNQFELAKVAYDEASQLAGINKDPYFSLYIENLNNIISRIEDKDVRHDYEAQILDD